MPRKIRLGFTRDFFDAEGNFIMPGPGPGVFDDMPPADRLLMRRRL
ncbi:MAG: hypothetical protein KKD83_01500 [Chloroflexi bacterium]|nr:hypothetical protein [Chloroflexota bacterium]